jgi:ketosteroid isomerase-like protein
MAARPAAPLLDAFADDALFAYWDGSGDETAERTVVHGRDAIHAALAATPEMRLVVSVRDDENWFVEGVLVAASGRPAATFVASAQLDVTGRIVRCLVFRCPPLEPSATWGRAAQTGAGDGLEILQRYLDHLVAGELVEARDCFSEDCLYSHPPYAPGTPRVEFRGREELLHGFRRTRGARSSRPRIVCGVQRGADCFVEGVVENDARPKGSFVSSATLDGEGLIRRYVAFYTSSRIPRR